MNAVYHCPRCRARTPLQPDAESEPTEWRCGECESRYPVVCGIADFRIAADPYISIEADRNKASGLAEKFADLDLAGLIDHYFAITPEVPPALAARYRVGLLKSGPSRIEALLALADERAGRQPRDARVLELACGSGPFLPVLAQRFDGIVALDIALRWLVVARRRLLELGLEDRVQLVCACAEALPFPADRFDLTIAANALEHVRDASQTLREVRRTLSASGTATFTTPNRFSPGPDPHVGIWGIGFLPRVWQDPVAQRMRGAGLALIHTRGYGELRRMLVASGFRRVHFALPAVPEADLAQRGAVTRALARAYNAVRGWAATRPLLLRLGPLFQIVARP